MRPVGSVALALAAAGCAPRMMATTDSPGAYPPVQVMPVDPVGIRPIPPIPAAMHGCWEAPAPDDPEEPGAAQRVIIGATTIDQTFEGGERNLATAEFVEEVTATAIQGRFSARDEHGLRTVATSLILGPDPHLSLGPGELRIAEGDAGSYHLTRCRQ